MDKEKVEFFGQIVDAIELLAEKYELSFDEAIEHAEFALSYSFSDSLNADVQVYLKPSCKIIVFYNDTLKELSPRQISKGVVKKAKAFLEYRFQCLHAHKIYIDAKKVIRTIVWGQIIKKTTNNALYVRFTNPYAVTEGGRVLVGVCPLEHQTPKERGQYWEGLYLHFFVTSVRGIVVDKIPKVVITVSRNSISLPEALLRNILIENGVFIEIKATKRIAGAYTEIKAQERIPKEYIKKVSEILKEGIIVKY
ncbi:hypothetical protein [Thermodesulfovibrio sp. TK110]